jgi:hypothetical protein
LVSRLLHRASIARHFAGRLRFAVPDRGPIGRANGDSARLPAEIPHGIGQDPVPQSEVACW